MAYVRTRRIPRPRPTRLIPTRRVVIKAPPIWQAPQSRVRELLQRRKFLQRNYLRRRPTRFFLSLAGPIHLSATLAGVGHLTATLTVHPNSLPVFEKAQPRVAQRWNLRKRNYTRYRAKRWYVTKAPVDALVATLAGVGHLTATLSVHTNSPPIFRQPRNTEANRRTLLRRKLRYPRRPQRFTPSLQLGIHLSATLAGHSTVTANMVTFLWNTISGIGHLTAGLSLAKNLSCTLAGLGTLSAVLSVSSTSAALFSHGTLQASISVFASPACIDINAIPLAVIPIQGYASTNVGVSATTLCSILLQGESAPTVLISGQPLCTIAIAGKVC